MAHVFQVPMAQVFQVPIVYLSPQGIQHPLNGMTAEITIVNGHAILTHNYANLFQLMERQIRQQVGLPVDQVLETGAVSMNRVVVVNGPRFNEEVQRAAQAVADAAPDIIHGGRRKQYRPRKSRKHRSSKRSKRTRRR